MKRTLFGCALLLAGCGGAASRATPATPRAIAPPPTTTTLGRVVVYRNGVAYFERTAKVNGDLLTLSVRADKIDDLLKSLTVVDVATSQPAPVAYRTDAKATQDGLVDMTIALTGRAPHELRLTYVVEAPAWKPSYRVVMRKDGEIDLQGWAVIDNTSGEDWNGVHLGVGSSSALSFRYDLRSIKTVPRETLRPDAVFALAPHAGDGQPASPASPAPPVAPPDTSTDPIGTAHFESPVPMTVRKGTSAMVSILHERTHGELVYLYDPESGRAGAEFPARALRIKNPTDSVLESGPMALFGEGRFVGEGLAEPIAARAVAYIPFALDRQVLVERRPTAAREAIAKVVSVQRGVVQAEMRHTTRTTFALENRLAERAVVYVRHTVAPGFRLLTPSAEPLGAADLFRVTLDPHATTELAIDEEAPIARALDVRAPDALALLEPFVAAAPADDPLRARVEALVKLARKVDEGSLRLTTLGQEIAAYEARAAELQSQIAELRNARTGAELQRELEARLRDIERGQAKSTADAAKLQDDLTIARIDFQNAAADLSVDTPGDARRASSP